MKAQDIINYDRIAEAIGYIQTNFKSQPNLEEVAEKVHLSPFHFQRLFTEWAGTSPKQFLQYISIGHAKKMIKENQSTLFDTAIDTGFSGSSRLLDVFIKMEGMTPGEYKNGGSLLSINYSFSETLFGNILVASTEKGICHIAFFEDELAALQTLQAMFPNAAFRQKADSIQQNALSFFSADWETLSQLKLHLKGSAFQMKIWESLLKIPIGKLVSYGQVARHIKHPNASRAVGSAVGHNPVAFLIPCHRVIKSSGGIGEYMWGSKRKKAIIGWEASQTVAEIAT